MKISMDSCFCESASSNVLDFCFCESASSNFFAFSNVGASSKILIDFAFALLLALHCVIDFAFALLLALRLSE